jgi:hypothetical protein
VRRTRYEPCHSRPASMDKYRIEVVEASLAYDRERKGRLYAAAGIQEYGLINLSERWLEGYR